MAAPSRPHEQADPHAEDSSARERGAVRPGERSHHHQMDTDGRQRRLVDHHRRTQWVYWTVMLLGAWLVLAPVSLGHSSQIAVPSGGRDIWLSLGWRVRLVTFSDILSGLGLLIFAFRSLKPLRPVSVWICCFIGIWLSLAPILFWAPTAAAYLNDTLCGMLVVALTVLIPGMPNMMMFMKMGPNTPPGWSYNPSSWPQRGVMIALGFAGLMASRYLAAYQLGYIEHAQDPFFGNGSELVLNSRMSHTWPVSDAAFGALAYTFEFLMGFMGSTARWRTMPWMVALYGILVIPLGLVHIALVVSQPVIVGSWCTICLLAAAIMLPMLPLEGDEVVAMGQHLAAAKQRGERFWDVFWKGGSADGCTADGRSPELMNSGEEPLAVARASLWGMTAPWTLVASSALGVALMALPGALGFEKPSADVFHLTGAIAVTVAVVSMGEVFRLIRYLNIGAGLVVSILPWLLGGAGALGAMLGTIGGVALALLALPRGQKRERYGSWDRFVR